MERAIDEVFEFEREMYKVEENEGCNNCGLDNGKCYDCEITGECSDLFRKDGKNVTFVKIVD